MGAVISEPSGLYRYQLDRVVDPIGDLIDRKTVTFIMLNPSTADAETDDPTLTRCISRAQREGGTYLQVVNLFAWRSPDPADLLAAHDPVGPDNDFWIEDALSRSDLVIAGWGTRVPKARKARVPEVVELVAAAGHDLWAVKTTIGGQPWHPLYSKADWPLTPWSLR